MTSHHDELLPFFDLEPPTAVSRRRFLHLFGGGIVVAVSARDLLALEQGSPRLSLARELPADFNAFLRIGEDGRVTGFTGKIEMGQGVVTSLAQMLADELEVPLESVDMTMGDTDICPWDMGTFGSMTTRFFGPPLRAAAAEAREVLIDIAATNGCDRDLEASEVWFRVTGWRDGDLIQTVDGHLFSTLYRGHIGYTGIGLPGSQDWYDRITLEVLQGAP